MFYKGEAEKMWLHIDAAYAGSAFVCPEFKPLLEGVEVSVACLINGCMQVLVQYSSSNRSIYIFKCEAHLV